MKLPHLLTVFGLAASLAVMPGCANLQKTGQYYIHKNDPPTTPCEEDVVTQTQALHVKYNDALDKEKYSLYPYHDDTIDTPWKAKGFLEFAIKHLQPEAYGQEPNPDYNQAVALDRRLPYNNRFEPWRSLRSNDRQFECR